MYRFAAVFAVLTVGVCLMRLAVASPVNATTPACPPNPSSPNSADPSMVLNTPPAGATVNSPVHISGLARVFEAQVSIVIYDANGGELVKTFTMASEGAPTLAPFTIDVPFTVTTNQAGCIRVFEASAKDGSPINVVQVEVNLAASTAPTPTATPPTATPTPAPVTPPSTGDAGLAASAAVDPAPVILLAALLTALLCVRLRRGGSKA